MGSLVSWKISHPPPHLPPLQHARPKVFHVAVGISHVVHPPSLLYDGSCQQAGRAKVESLVVRCMRYCLFATHALPSRLSYWVIVMTLRLVERVLLGWIIQTLRWVPLVKIGLAIWLMSETTDMESNGELDTIQERKDKEAYRVSLVGPGMATTDSTPPGPRPRIPYTLQRGSRERLEE